MRGQQRGSQKIKLMKKVNIDFENVLTMDMLIAADFVVRDGKEVSKTMKEWDRRWDINFQILFDDLINGTYQLSTAELRPRRTKGGKMRNIIVLHHRDNIVCEVITRILDPILTPTFVPNTYANIKGRGPQKCQDSIVRDLSKYKYPYFLKMDIEKYYESMDYDIMHSVIKRKVCGNLFLATIYKILEFFKHLPIGARHSPICGNAFLSELDRKILQDYKLSDYYRYCDDMVILHEDKKVLHTAKRDISNYLESNRKLNIKRTWVVRPVDAQGIDFLGSVIYTYKIRLRTSVKKRHEQRLAELNKKPASVAYEDGYMSALKSILMNRDTINLLIEWRGRYENVFERFERRQAARAAINACKERNERMAAQLQYNGEIADGLISRGYSV